MAPVLEEYCVDNQQLWDLQGHDGEGGLTDMQGNNAELLSSPFSDLLLSSTFSYIDFKCEQTRACGMHY